MGIGRKIGVGLGAAALFSFGVLFFLFSSANAAMTPPQSQVASDASASSTTTVSAPPSGTSSSTTTTDELIGAPPLVANVPEISSLIVGTTSATDASITWTTDQFSSSEIVYGTSTVYTATSTGASALNHEVVLTNLSPSTTYHFEAVSENGNGSGTSPDATFVTPGAPAPSGLSIENISAIPTETTATILWNTTEPSSSSIQYGTSTPYDMLAQANDMVVSALSTSHLVVISNLSPGTTYHFAVISRDIDSATSSADQTFTTLAQ